MSASHELQFLYTNKSHQPTAKWSLITLLLGAYALSCAFLVFFLAGRMLPIPAEPEESTENIVKEPVLEVELELESPDFSSITVVAERKDAFFGFLAPLAEWENRKILRDRERLLAIHAELESKQQLSPQSRKKLNGLVEEYRLANAAELTVQEQIDTLLRRADIIPLSMVLAQAATESAWGTSRFAVEGNNYFGQWCFRRGCGLVPLERGAGQRHEVAFFPNALESVRSYIRNINTHPAYRELRQIRAGLRAAGESLEGLKLIRGLQSYSERGEDYIAELRQIIRGNDLHKLDLPSPDDKT